MRATRDFQSIVLGYVSKGDYIPDDRHGEHLLSIGLAERETYDTKVVRQTPTTRKKVSRGRKRKDSSAS